VYTYNRMPVGPVSIGTTLIKLVKMGSAPITGT
jgi:hypothetical protein